MAHETDTKFCVEFKERSGSYPRSPSAQICLVFGYSDV